MAANNKGIQLVQELIQEYSLKVVQAYMHYIQVRMHAVTAVSPVHAKNCSSHSCPFYPDVECPSDAAG